MTTDSTTFTGGNGIVRNVDEWFELMKSRKARRDSLGATVSWKTTAIFSVDIAPGEGGELVHNYFDAKYTMWHIDPSGKMKGRLSFKGYESGHMMYLRREDLKNSNDDIREFIRNTIPSKPAKY